MKSKNNFKTNDIAIIGYSCRFPGANHAGQYWNNLKNGVSSITPVPKQRWDSDKFYSPLRDEEFKSISKHGGFIDDANLFDANYFRIKEDRARLMDPQQKLLLELSAEAINHAGYDKKGLSGSQTSVFIGAASGDYGIEEEYIFKDGKVITNGALIGQRNGFIGSLPNMIPAVVSNFFNLLGPSLSISTACSSSLVAVSLACQNILAGECRSAIAGGVQLYLSPTLFIGNSKTGSLSPDGKCKTFSKEANGYVLSEGVGVCLLKHIDDAIDDGDSIYAIIKSSSVNNDGKTMSAVMPNIHAQKNVIFQALNKGKIDPSTIGYLEANGTGLQVGDPLEIKAANMAYRNFTNKNQYCAIGSVEPNIGHAIHAAGIASLIKVILVLMHKQIPPAIYCDELNPKINFAETPFFPNKEIIDFMPVNNCRRAGINAFGFGGTNCHIIVEEFDNAKYDHYKPTRKPLPVIQFNKKDLSLKKERKENSTIEKISGVDKEMSQRDDSTVKDRQGHYFSKGSDNDSIGETCTHHMKRRINTELICKIEIFLKKLVAENLSISVDEIDSETGFMDFGIDSIMLEKMISVLTERINQEIHPSVLFENQNISELTQYLATEYGQQFQNVFGINHLNTDKCEISHNDEDAASKTGNVNNGISVKKKSNDKNQDIAIIGMSGIMPLSDDLEEFWTHLEKERDLISEVPIDRWDWKELYGDPENEPNKTNIKHGGFIRDVDKFDAAFFKISPREAELMDPQHRLLLETVWKTIEDANYRPSDLAGTNTGLFVGISNVDYHEKILTQRVDTDSYFLTGNTHSVLVNRISYFLDFHGPSKAIDTACSSSLVALCTGVEAIRSGICSSAFVGGVNTIITPTTYIAANKSGMLSEDGRCKTFSNEANGYARGEGVGVIYLKPLEKAEEDKDYIYAVIKGVAENHGGFASSLTAPNPAAQADLIVNAYEQAGISPDTVTYIEAHGTGTKLGDPIEIEGLKKGFSELYTRFGVKQEKINYCGLGSVKTNIGHLESAAGIAGIIKVLLCMKYKKLNSIIHFNKVNPYIYLEKSPFYIVDKSKKWKRLKDRNNNEIPRRAGVSSFGFGGSNAHVVLEEYENKQNENVNINRIKGHQVVILSALDEERLGVYALNLLNFLKKANAGPVENRLFRLADIAYTLQTGRNEMAERLAIIAENIEELAEILEKYIEKEKPIENLYTGNIIRKKSDVSFLLKGRAGNEFIRIAAEDKELSKLAQLWINGIEIDWKILHLGSEPRKISLPTYPFKKKRFWLSEQESGKKSVKRISKTAYLHPLLDSNISNYREQKFTTELMGTEFYMSDHVIEGDRVLPDMAHIEMARAADMFSGGGNIIKIKNIVWKSPVKVMKKPKTVCVRLYPNKGYSDYQVISYGHTKEKEVYSQGKMVYETENVIRTRSEYVDIEAIKKTCRRQTSGQDCYSFFKSIGFIYGSGFQVIKELYDSESQALSRLELPLSVKDGFGEFALHPSVMVGALQTVLGLLINENIKSQTLFLPQKLDEIEIFQEMTDSCYVHVISTDDHQAYDSDVKKYNITIIDDYGKVIIKMKDFSIRALIPDNLRVKYEELSKNNAARQSTEILYYNTVWKETEVEKIKNNTDAADIGNVLLFSSSDSMNNSLKDHLGKMNKPNANLVMVKPGKTFRNCGDNIFEIDPAQENDYGLLIEVLNNSNLMPDRIIHCWSNKHGSFEKNLLSTQLEQGVYSLLYICRMLMKIKLKGNIQMIYVYPGNNRVPEPQFAANVGFCRSVARENRRFKFKTVEVETGLLSAVETNKLADILIAEIHTTPKKHVDIQYSKNKRFVKVFNECQFDQANGLNAELKQNGVYILTGGTGGLGFIFAEYLAKSMKARLILTGRSDLSDDKKKKIMDLKSKGAEVIYIQSDVSKREDVEEVIKKAKSKFKKINGVIHSAGVLRDSYIPTKTRKEMEAVLLPKVYGTINLDEATKEEPLDFFVMFSSIASVLGNAGQCDYAFANSFMDNFTQQREMLRQKGERAGKSLSINWPLWKDGGMNVDKETAEIIENEMGIKQLNTISGLEAFKKGLSWNICQFMVVEGYRNKLNRLLDIDPEEPGKEYTGADRMNVNIDAETLLEHHQNDILDIVSEMLKISKDDLDLDLGMVEYGFDSISLKSFSSKISSKYNIELTPDVFYDYTSIRSLLQFMCEEYKKELVSYYTHHLKEISRTKETSLDKDSELNEKNIKMSLEEMDMFSKFQTGHYPDIKSEKVYDPIAIIGINCIMPKSGDKEELWENLISGENLISEIPEDRWDWKAYYGDPDIEKNKTDTRWGGFLDDVDKFDALFFGISPEEANLMDPQQRIMLEAVWKTFEDAGYKPSKMKGTETGVFVGAAPPDYAELLHKNDVHIEKFTPTGVAHAIIANRISYLFDLHGPSETINTACSSSTTAIHRAISAIHNGECKQAIAGGVTILLSPTSFIGLRKLKMLSSTEKGSVFHKDASGFIRGEGGGAVLLKSLRKAEQDGDYIYAVIKGSAVNHGGRGQSLTSPNPRVQSEVIISAYKKANIDPGSVSYIEAQGTGTEIGDPLEINAYKRAFKELFQYFNTPYNNDDKFCGIGALKPNIGHLEPASGIASLVKVCMAFKHKKLPGIINMGEVNPYVNLNKSPFYIIDKTKVWEQPLDVNGKPVPRRAGINSFGFGGSNAHLVLEEYAYPSKDEKNNEREKDDPEIFIFSAKNWDRLNDYLKKFRTFLSKTEHISLKNTAYTLQVGREEMDVRLSIIANSKNELIQHIGHYLINPKVSKSGLRIFTGEFSQTKNDSDVVSFDTLKDHPEKIAFIWATGGQIPWEELHTENNVRKISLPSYAFERKRHWFSENDVRLINNNTGKQESQNNIQEIFDQRFVYNEPYLRDHLVFDYQVLLGVTYCSLIIEKICQYDHSKKINHINKLLFSNPVILYPGEKADIHVISEEIDNKIIFTCYCNKLGNREKTKIASGITSYASLPQLSPIDISAFIEQSEKQYQNDLYKSIRAQSIVHGPSLMSLKKVYVMGDEALGVLSLSSEIKSSRGKYHVHPALLDASIVSALYPLIDHFPGTFVPLMMKNVYIYNDLPDSCYCRSKLITKNSEIIVADIRFCDENGDVLLFLEGLACKRVFSADIFANSQAIAG